ncbi:uncharacterized protein LOC127860377 isoform X2 [Dreissena polymorpha]|uniref:uncharacterized protein LOC127860377 isoform X2 n=1 Tax=Dreissena polymorpha TaxID=45954 RepID=UPI002263CD2D|nr:uncharacterized protein LOC127860377 isoform X2 [Dreissena polymorpha]
MERKNKNLDRGRGKQERHDSRDNRSRHDGDKDRERDCMGRVSNRRERYASNSSSNSSSSDSEDNVLRGSHDRKFKRHPEYDRQHSRNSQDDNDERKNQSRDTRYSLDQDSRRVSTDKDPSSKKKKQSDRPPSRGSIGDRPAPSNKRQNGRSGQNASNITDRTDKGREKQERRDSRDNRSRHDGGKKRERDCMGRDSNRRERYASKSSSTSSGSDSEDTELRGSHDRKDKRHPEYDRQHSRNSRDDNDERNSLSRDTSYSLDQDSRRVSTDKDQSSNKKKQSDRPPSRGSIGDRPAPSNKRRNGRSGQNANNITDRTDSGQYRPTGAVHQQQQSPHNLPAAQQQQSTFNMPPAQQQQHSPYNMPPTLHQQSPYNMPPTQQQNSPYNMHQHQQQQYPHTMAYPQQHSPYNMPTLQQQPALAAFASGPTPHPVFANGPPPQQHTNQFVGNATYPIQPSPPSLLGIPTPPFTGSGQMYRTPSQVDVSNNENESGYKYNSRNPATKEKQGKRKPKSGGGKDTKTKDDDKNRGGTKDIENPSGGGKMYRTPSRVDISKDENKSRDNHNTRNHGQKINKGQQNYRTDRGQDMKTNDNRNYRSGTKEMTSEDSQAVPDEEARLIRDVFNYMVKHFNGSGSPENIRRESGLFPTDFDVVDWFKKKREFTTLGKDGNVITVNVCKKSIQYCFNYIKRSGCNDSKCKHFHLCKDFLSGSCCFSVKCNFSHNAKDSRNIIAARRYGIDQFSNEEIINVLALRFPHVCQEWAKAGSCPNSICFNLHVCPGYINGQCKDQNCPKCHDRTSLHNDPIVSAYEMKTWNETFFRKAVYLIRENENKEDAPEIDHDDTAIEPNKEVKLTQDVFQFIVKNFDGSGSPEDIRRESGLFPTDFDVSDWFKKNKQFAAFEKDGKVISVTVCRKDVSYCFSYIKQTGCANEICRRFHVCKDFLCGYCCFGDNCHYKHSVTDKQNIMAAQKCGLDNFTNEEIVCILKRRYPHVCKEWVKSETCPASFCNDLHICPGYINGKCHEYNCSKSHDRMSPHNGRIVNAYGLAKTDEQYFRKAVYLVRNREVASGVEENLDLLNTDIAGQKSICTAFLVGDCKKKGCKQIHSDLPYIWQVKLWDEWRKFSCQETVEELFSKPDKNATNQIVYNDLTGDCRSATFNIIFEPLHATCIDSTGKRTIIEVRRLSTKSYAFGKALGSEPFRTEWRWYLEFTPGEWHLMEPDYLQLTVETKYLAKQVTWLYTRENFKSKYQLNFDRNDQLNLGSQVCRNIRRRPLFVSENDVKQQISPSKLTATPSAQVDLPCGWVPWDYFQSFEWVKLSLKDDDYKRVSENFYKTLDPSKQIIDDIFRVQNHVLWSTFSNHLERVMKPKKIRLGDLSPVTTLDLYHGTDNLEAVRGISINSFDSRTSGKNMTRFGDGAYFATDAKYSHEYTKGPHRFMFQAKVLVGEATEGKPEYRRPPSRPGMDHELYDSCVDVLKNPRTYVLWEKAQCYPEFIIHYHSIGDLKNTPAQDATELTSCCLL